MSHFKAKMHQIRFRWGSWGSAPDPTAGAYSTPPDPIAGFKGHTTKGGVERRKGREVILTPQSKISSHESASLPVKWLFKMVYLHVVGFASQH